MDIRQFLIENNEEALKFLHGTLHTLHYGSVAPILELMKEKKILKLIGPNDWELNQDGKYHNKFAKGMKQGHALRNTLHVFEGQNTYLNPFYQNYSLDDEWKEKSLQILDKLKSTKPLSGFSQSQSTISGALVINHPEKIQSLEQYVKRVTALGQERGNDASGIIWFRGHSSTEYLLTPSLYRKNSSGDFIYTYKDEHNFLSYFKSYAYPYIKIDRPQNDLEWLVFAQHFGLPTRLMDFTIDPLVALAFALEVDRINKVATERNDDKDAVVYFFRPMEYNARIPNPPNGIPHLTELQGKQSQYVPGTNESDVNEPIACITIFNNENISSQKGTFIMFARTNPDRIKTLKDHVNDDYILSEIIIASEKKAEIREHLYRIGYNISRLYPNLYSVASDIKFVLSQ